MSPPANDTTARLERGGRLPAEPPAFDAWVLSRLRAGHDLNGEIDGVSEAFRMIARRMAGADPGDRGAPWDAFIGLMDPAEADALVDGVARADPDGEAPEGEPWGPLRLGELPPVEPFPDYVLPEPVADFVRVVADSIGCPPDFVGLSALVVAGAAVGRSASLMLKPGYFVSTSLYGLNVGGPSSGKSPAQEAAVEPMWRADERFYELYKSLKQSYDEAMEAMSGIAKGQPKPAPPVKPVLESAVLEDCTVEAVAPILAINPRGLLVARDEGSAWTAGLGQYKNGRGSDRQFWLSALFGKPVRVDRKGNPDLVPIRVPHPFLSFVGGMPPDMLAGLREPGGRSDGFVERVLFVMPDPRPRPHWSDSGIPDEARTTWAGVVQKPRDRPMAVTEGKSHPEVYRFSHEAKAAWVAWYDAHADTVNDPAFDPAELAMEGKLCDFAARLALILQLTHQACDPIAPDPDRPPYVSRWAVSGAIKLWSYFRAHHQRVRAFLEGRHLGGAPEGARLVLRWLRHHPGVETFPESELTRVVPKLNKNRALMEDGLLWLAQLKAVRRVSRPDQPKSKRGRKPAPVWEVHPELRNLENTENKDKSCPQLTEEPVEVNSPYSPYSPNSVSEDEQEGGGDDPQPF